MLLKIKSLIIVLALCTGSFAQSADTILIHNHLTKITKTAGHRHYQDLATLNSVAEYIFKAFEEYSDCAYYQEYTYNGDVFKNVICSFGDENAETIVVGAHYDVCGEQEGADDNATGVVGLLELARMLKGQKLNYRIEIVAYSLEEPPFFRTKYMGSYVHAKSLVDEQINVYGMVCLEMIGYFDNAKKSQSYPLGILSLIYGNRGDFITLVNKFGKGKFARKFTKRSKRNKVVKTKKFTGPESLQGVDFSDHLNYWKFGISAMMITDTSFYRNHHYHEKTDTMEKLDIGRMAQVIDGVLASLLDMK